MPEWICLPRAINLGSVNKVGMPQLRKALEAAGFDDVRTYVQSGNVVMASRKGTARVSAELEEAIAERLGVRTPVIVRTRDELAEVIARNPLPEAVADPKRFQVSFLSGKPATAIVRRLTRRGS